jgi:hypothetical protein
VANGFGDAGNANGAQAAAQASTLARSQTPSEEVTLSILACLMLLAVLVAPPLVGRWIRRDGK